MLAWHLIAAAAPKAEQKVWAWLYHLGGPGLIVLGIVDCSLLPAPGSMDTLVILLAAHHKSLWFYYAGMATAGAVLGAYITFRIARKEGKEHLRKALSHGWKKVVADFFKKWRFWAVFVAALLPPPLPTVPIVVAAGATEYSTKRFLASMSLGRTIRYGVVAYFANLYGKSVLRIFSQYGWPIFYTLLGLAVFSGLSGFIFQYWEKHKSHGKTKAKAKAA